MRGDKKILIAVPAMDQVATGFAQSLATVEKVGKCSVSFMCGSLVYDSRNKLAAQAVKMEADYVMWFDSDMIFDSNTIVKMVEHMENGYDIVSGLYFRRQPPFTPVLFSKLELDSEGIECIHEDYDDYPSEMFEIAGCGFGCVMMKIDVLFDIAAEHSAMWFSPIGNIGEDCAFCIRARESGYKIFCDPTISCGHVGHNIIGESFYRQYKELSNVKQG